MNATRIKRNSLVRIILGYLSSIYRYEKIIFIKCHYYIITSKCILFYFDSYIKKKLQEIIKIEIRNIRCSTTYPFSNKEYMKM